MADISAYQAKFFAYALTLEGGTGVGRLQQSLMSASVDLNPHQVEAALFALRSPISKGVLLADEVGLGKTIEAGLTLCQLWAERKRRMLIVCPASLRKQWQCELEEKFNLPCVIVDAKAAHQLQKEGFSNPFAKPAILITSYAFAAHCKDDLRVIPWNLVVMDEAHKLRNCYRESNKVGQALKWALSDRRKLLLTATPLQNSLSELYGIGTLLDDQMFGDLASFKSRYMNAGGDLSSLKTRMKDFAWRTLRKDVEAFVKYTKRFPMTETFECTDQENALYEDVSAYLQDATTYAFPPSQRSMLTLLVRKVLSSSSVALAGTLERILARLQSLAKDLKPAEHPLLESLFEDDPDLIDEIAEDIEDGDAEDENSSGHDPRVHDAPEDEARIDPVRLRQEISRVEDLLRRARSVGTDKKTQHLVLALEKGWARLREIGASDKAVVFTESRRTMAFLKDYLEAHGYAGQVMCFSGGGKRDATAEDIYARYRAAHPEDPSSKPVMMRHALIDAFKNQAKILIATEAGAEGINLQFCSMVVNYDLPWNPQRVEQRIGRCHRYGQKFNVIVINFLNRRNAADVRVFELLDQKFHLFEGLFGASNGILGVVDRDGKSFEREINDILQKCQRPEEIQAEFDRLQAKWQDEIAARMEKTRQDILENLDDDVRRHLKVDYGEAKDLLSEGETRFRQMTEYLIGDRMHYRADDELTFDLVSAPAPAIPTGDYTFRRGNIPSGVRPYRLNGELGEWAIAAAKVLPTPTAEVTFDISHYAGKMSTITALRGKSGTLMLEKMTVNALDEDGFLLFTGFTDDGNMVPREDLERLFKLTQTVGSAIALTEDVQRKLAENAKLLAEATLQKNMQENNTLFKERLVQLDRWVGDQIAVAEHALQCVKDELRSARRAQETATNEQELASAADKVSALERKRRQARQAIDDREDEAVEKRSKIVTELRKRMVQDVRRETLFTLRWKVI